MTRAARASVGGRAATRAILRAAVVVAGALASACAQAPAAARVDASELPLVATRLSGWPDAAVWDACTGPALAGQTTRALWWTTTDFSTGAVTGVDAATGAVAADVALSTTDAIPVMWDADTLAVVHRFGFDRVDLFDVSEGVDGGATLTRQMAVPTTQGKVANAQSLFARGDHALLSSYGLPWLTHLHDDGDALRPIARADLTDAGDADALPEVGVMWGCGDVALAFAADYDAGFAFQSRARVFAARVSDGAVWDLDDTTPGLQAPRLLGNGVKQVLPSQHTAGELFALTEGVERVTLSPLSSQWLVSPEQLATLGVTDPFQLMAFALDADEQRVFLLHYNADYTAARVVEWALDSGQSTVVLDGLDVLGPTMQRVGDALHIGSSRVGARGLWTLSLTTTPASLTPASASAPASLGLSPLAVVAQPGT